MLIVNIIKDFVLVVLLTVVHIFLNNLNTIHYKIINC